MGYHCIFEDQLVFVVLKGQSQPEAAEDAVKRGKLSAKFEDVGVIIEDRKIDRVFPENVVESAARNRH